EFRRVLFRAGPPPLRSTPRPHPSRSPPAIPDQEAPEKCRPPAPSAAPSSASTTRPDSRTSPRASTPPVSPSSRRAPPPHASLRPASLYPRSRSRPTYLHPVTTEH